MSSISDDASSRGEHPLTSVSAGGHLRPGDVLGDYEILAVAGEGGMGVVYKARQRSLERTVALKVIRPDLGSDPEFNERFLREARLAASVQHPHVVTVYDAGHVDGRLFLAMQWVDGRDLQQTLEHDGPLPVERAVQIVSQLAGALDAVHAVGLVHRDVKPGNVLIGKIAENDQAYLTDFGVARPLEDAASITKSGSVIGTVGYMAPEQIQGLEPDARSDLYALGCLFFQAIAGSPPFQAENELALRWAHANSPRPLLSAVLATHDRRFDEFLLVALAVDPQDRFASGRAFAKALVTSYENPVIDTTPPAGQPAPPEHPMTAVGAVTPLPITPQGMMTPMAFPAYGYLTPPPQAPAPQRSGNPLALMLLAVVALAGIGVGALAATGALSSNNARTQTTTRTAIVANQPLKRSHPASALAPAPAPTVPNTTTPPDGGGMESCGGDVEVLASTTSCPFGLLVEQAYLESSGGNTTVTAPSPVTGQTYEMYCTGGSPHVCTGGVKAEVMFYASPQSSPSPSPSPTPSPSPPPGNSGTTQDCGPNNSTISVNSVTTCGFAANVFKAYWQDWQQSGAQSYTVTAHSPQTGKDYSMDCTTDGTTVTCMGGNNALVTFPLTSIQNYP